MSDPIQPLDQNAIDAYGQMAVTINQIIVAVNILTSTSS